MTWNGGQDFSPLAPFNEHHEGAVDWFVSHRLVAAHTKTKSGSVDYQHLRFFRVAVFEVASVVGQVVRELAEEGAAVA